MNHLFACVGNPRSRAVLKGYRSPFYLIWRIWSLLTFSLLWIPNSQAQNQQNNVTITVKNASFPSVLESIRKQTEYDFSYNDKILPKANQVTLHLVEVPLAKALNELFKNQPFDYEIDERIIIVTEKAASDPSRLGTKSNDLQSPIRGRVYDNHGKPLVGATIKSKHAKYKTSSDGNGYFIIPTEYANSILEINYLGYETLEIPAQRARTATLNLKSLLLEEANVTVKTGYQEIDQRKLTSAVTTVKMDDIKVAGINRIDQLLEGRIPGMIFMQNSGQVGSAPKLRVRGTSTILGNREPLWVLDGIVLTDPVNVDPQQINDLDFVNLLGNAIAGLNPEDIDQIDVLKDASATALYGAKAGNGVIVITTKKGKGGKPTISYTVTSSLTTRPKYSDRSIYMMDSRERMDVSKEMFERKMQYNNVTQWAGYEKALQDYYSGNINYDEFKSQSDYYASVNTDWLGALTQNSHSSNHTLSLSGGENSIKYYTSLGYTDENGVIKGEYNKRYSSMINITADYKKFLAQFSFSGNYSSKNYTPSDLGIMNYAYNMSRTIPIYDTDGSLFFYPQYNGSLYYDYNILKERDNSNDHTLSNAANLKAYLKYKVIPGLDIEGTFAYGISNNNRELYYTKDSYYIFKLRANQTVQWDMAPVGGELQKSDTRNNNYTGRLQLNYSKSFGPGKMHVLTATGGMEVKSSEYKGYNITRRGYFPERGGYFDYIPTTYTGYYGQWMYTKAALGYNDRQLTNEVAWYGTTGYSWNNKYMMNFHVRGEQSNLFGTRTNNSFMPIWALSGRWNMKDDILKNTKWVNDLAFRTSWGWQGNMLPGQSAYMVIREATVTDAFYNEPYANIVNYPNPDLKWERTSSSNFALDFSLFNNRLNGSVSYFYKRTKDAFLNKTVSEINGVQQYVINSGTLENKGIEVALRVTAIDNAGVNGSKRGFVWRIDPQLGQVLNKVLNSAINNRNNVLVDEVTYTDFLNGTVQLGGKPINTFYSYKFKGLSNKDGSPIFYDTETELADEYRAKYAQMQKEDVYLAVMSESGRREPFLQGGISNYFGWLGFGLSFNMTYSLGNKIRMLKLASGYSTSTAYPQQNLRKEFVYRWRRPGDEEFTTIPGLNASNTTNTPWWNVYPATAYSFGGTPYEMYDYSDERLVSGDFLKLQSLSFRYNFTDKLVKNLGLSSAYVSLTGTNLFTLASSKLKGQDPTQSGSSPNINLTVRPVYSGTLNIAF